MKKKEEKMKQMAKEGALENKKNAIASYCAYFRALPA